MLRQWWDDGGRLVLRCALAMFFISLTGTVLNAEVYSSIAPYFGISREISTLFTALVFITIGFIAHKKPSVLDVRLISIVVIAILVMAGFLLTLALELKNPLFVLVGLFCRAIGSAWGITVFSVALAGLPSARSVLAAVGVGMIASDIVWHLMPTHMPLMAASFLVMACAALPIVLMYHPSEAGFHTIRQSATASSLGVPGVAQFASLRSLVLCMLLFGIAAGYALTLNEQGDAPVETIIETILFAGIVVVLVAGDAHTKREGREDLLFSLAVLLIIAGFLIAPLSFEPDAAVANVLLRLGRSCFDLIIWLVLTALGRRNIFLLLPVLGLARCMNSIGVDIGATAGRVTDMLLVQAPDSAGTVTALLVFAFIAFLWLGFRDFRFSRVINDVEIVNEPEISRIGDYLEHRCHTLGQERGLTEREVEILSLLAQGRDGKFIAERYVLSYNTVKTHIKHIYQKLDVHSRQELIDTVSVSKGEEG